MTSLALISQHTGAVTYSFQTTGSWTSWALCTVNDRTGELLITSNWGNWSHRWNADPRALGHPTLTAFIGTRADVDYLARKLQREGKNGRRFSATETAKNLRLLLCQNRLEYGRGEWPIEKPGLTMEVARYIWEALDQLVDDVFTGNGDSHDLFYERIGNIEGFSLLVTGEPWGYHATEQTVEDKALRDIILPALIAACKARVAAGPP